MLKKQALEAQLDIYHKLHETEEHVVALEKALEAEKKARKHADEDQDVAIKVSEDLLREGHYDRRFQHAAEAAEALTTNFTNEIINEAYVFEDSDARTDFVIPVRSRIWSKHAHTVYEGGKVERGTQECEEDHAIVVQTKDRCGSVCGGKFEEMIKQEEFRYLDHDPEDVVLC